MASTSGVSSGSSLSSLAPSSYGPEEELQAMMDQRKRKRMLSNRESARRSRMRKQKYRDDLMVQLNQLRAENQHIFTTLTVKTHHLLAVEAENSVLRTQMMELTNRLQSLNDILIVMNVANDNPNGLFDGVPLISDSYPNLCSLFQVNQPIMVSADTLRYC